MVQIGSCWIDGVAFLLDFVSCVHNFARHHASWQTTATQQKATFSVVKRLHSKYLQMTCLFTKVKKTNI